MRARSCTWRVTQTTTSTTTSIPRRRPRTRSQGTTTASTTKDFKTNCSNVVQESNGTGYWTQFASCTPGDWIKDLAKWFYEVGCKNDVTWGVRWLPCGLGLIFSGVFWAIWGIWFGIWFVLALIASLVVAILDWVVNIVGAVVSAAVGLVEGVWG
jgi:hypothetical protein